MAISDSSLNITDGTIEDLLVENITGLLRAAIEDEDFKLYPKSIKDLADAYAILKRLDIDRERLQLQKEKFAKENGTTANNIIVAFPAFPQP